MFRGNTKGQSSILANALHGGAEYVDVGLSWGKEFVQDLVDTFGANRVICSYHDLKKTPRDLGNVYDRCRATGAGTIKIATTANSISDNVIMFDVLDRARKNRQEMIGICMGERGVISRILGGKHGSWLSFASLTENEKTGAGQLTVSEMNTIFRAGRISRRTKVFGLVGNPVRHSRGIYFHNERFRRTSSDAVYVNFLTDDIDDFWNSYQRLITGLSITMPFKQKIIPLLDRVDPVTAALRSVNTVIRKRNRYTGYNTDYLAVEELLGRHGSLKGRSVVILGAGGIARAMCAAAVRFGAHVTILARTAGKAKALAADFSCQWNSLDQAGNLSADFVMNATPIGMSGSGMENQAPLPSPAYGKNTVMFDAVYNPPLTPLLKDARRKGCKIIRGTELFERQAILQSRMFIGAIS